MSSWFYRVKKYIWHEEKTPFHLSTFEMSKKQAHSEVFLFASFEGVLASLFICGFLNQIIRTGQPNYVPGLGYCIILMGALYFLVKHKLIWAGLFSLTPPIVIFGTLLWLGFHPNNGFIEKILIGGFLIFWIFYAKRIFEITRNYHLLDNKESSRGVKLNYH